MFRNAIPSHNDFAVQAEMVAVDTSIDVGNVLWIFYDCLFSNERSSADSLSGKGVC